MCILLKAETPFELKNEEVCWTIQSKTQNGYRKAECCIGLAFKNETIIIAEQSRWQEVSMHERIAFRMPSINSKI
jgi:hypothetical protein